MQFIATAIPDVILIKPKVFGDDRGFFMETWNANTFLENGLDLRFVQDNHSKSAQGTLRGLHYQTQQTQGKLVRVVAGEVFDVAVDLRRASPTFGKWVGEYLSADDKLMLWIPPGFAHGFYVTSESAEFTYKCTEFYAPKYECTLAWDDPEIDIAWPLEKGGDPRLSDKDRIGLSFRDATSFE